MRTSSYDGSRWDSALTADSKLGQKCVRRVRLGVGDNRGSSGDGLLLDYNFTHSLRNECKELADSQRRLDNRR